MSFECLNIDFVIFGYYYPGFLISNDTSRNCSPRSLTFIHFGHVSDFGWSEGSIATLKNSLEGKVN